MGNKGFAYLGALVLVVVCGIALTAGSEYWSTIAKREREKELLFRGGQIRKAIESYYKHVPGSGSPTYPSRLEDLLKDPRYLALYRYLRKIYPDPMTKDGKWGLVLAPGGGVKGVFSKSKNKPAKTGNFPVEFQSFADAKTYSDWKFVYNP